MSSTFPFPVGDRRWSTASMDVDEPPAGDGDAGGENSSSDSGTTGNGRQPTNGSGQTNGSGPAKLQKSRRGRRNGRRAESVKPAVRPTKPDPVRSIGVVPPERLPADDQAPDRQLSRVGELEDRVERLSVICEAMWDLLSTEIGLDLDRLAARVDEMDPGVGYRLEHHGSDDSSCPICGKPMPARADSCLFCAARSAEVEAENWPKIDD